MADKDIAINSASVHLPTGPQAKVVPYYLIKLKNSDEPLSYKRFIAMDTLNLNPDFIHVKGFFTDALEDDIVTGYREIIAGLQATDKLEMWFPWHSIHHIRSLSFKTSNK